MPNVSSPAALPHTISQLLAQHKQHSDALALIEATLARVTAALGGSVAKAVAPTAPPVKRGRPFSKVPPAPAFRAAVAAKAPATKPAPKPVAKPAAKKPAKGGMTANEFVLAFVTAKKNPTTQEINKNWKEAGRLGAADNSLSMLTKSKQLKRLPMEGGLRGSRYTIA